jgi:glycosyltransferase involved in cell wall biosynthesis
MYVGQHRWVKNLRRIIEAHEILRDKGVDCIQVMVGGGLDAEDIKDEVAQKGLNDRFRFTGVIQDRDLLGSYYARADAFTFPSLYDTDGLVVKEAAAYRTPSIVVHDTGASESIQNEKNGFVVEDNPESLAAVMETLVKKPLLARAAGEGASKSVYRPWSEVFEKLVTTYESLIADYRDRAFKRIWAISKEED